MEQTIIKPIKTEEDYTSALAQIDALGDHPEGTEEYDLIDALVTLVEAYEAKHYPIGPPDPIAAIEYAMEKRGLTRQDLVPILGPSGRVSEILRRQRRLTMAMIRRLQASLNISAEVLIRDYPLEKPGHIAPHGHVI